MNIGLAMLSALRSFLMMINTSIYSLIATLYSLFIDIATWDLLENSDIVEGIAQRVGLILTLFMVFKLSFSLIQALINPDDNALKGSTKLVTRVVVVLVLFATINVIFDEAKDLQRIVVAEDNVIYKIILGSNTTNQDEDFTNFGNNLATDTFFSFYTDNEAPNLDSESMSSNTIGGCSSAEECYQIIKTENYSDVTFAKASDMVNETDDNDNYIIEFDGWTAIAVGIFMLYIMISYILSVGVRTVQLAFLQIIAPIPLLSYLSPKDETAFNKWVKMCITTYVDVFLRLAIIFFAVYLIQSLNDIDLGPDRGLSMKLVLILSILMFAKQAPKLLGELFPKSLGSIGFGLGVGAKLKEMAGFGFVTGAVGAAGAAALGAAGAAVGNAEKKKKNDRGLFRTIRSSLSGAVSGGLRGAKAGFQNGVKGGLFGIGKSGLSGVQGASMARNQRDPSFGMKYGWGDKLKDQFAQTTGQRQKFGASGVIGGEIKEIENNMANRQSAIESGLQQMRDLMNTHETLKSAFSFNIGTGNFERNNNIADYNDYLNRALSAKGTTQTQLQADAMYRSQITGNPDIIEYNNMLSALGVANADEFAGFESNITNVGNLMDAQAADKKRKGQLEGSIPKKDK